MPGYQWNEQRTQAAELVYVGRLTDLEIAAKVGISDRQLRRWKRMPEFQARLQEHMEAYNVLRMTAREKEMENWWSQLDENASQLSDPG